MFQEINSEAIWEKKKKKRRGGIYSKLRNTILNNITLSPPATEHFPEKWIHIHANKTNKRGKTILNFCCKHIRKISQKVQGALIKFIPSLSFLKATKILWACASIFVEISLKQPYFMHFNLQTWSVSQNIPSPTQISYCN